MLIPVSVELAELCAAVPQISSVALSIAKHGKSDEELHYAIAANVVEHDGRVGKVGGTFFLSRCFADRAQ